MAVWENLTPFPNDPNVGAFHGSDVPIIFGTYEHTGFGNGTATENERKLSVEYMNAWLTFAEVSFLCVLSIVRR